MNGVEVTTVCADTHHVAESVLRQPANRDTSAASAARFLARSKPTHPRDPRRPYETAIQRTTLQQILVGAEYRYRDVQTGREYTAPEARALTGPRVVRCIDESPRSA